MQNILYKTSFIAFLALPVVVFAQSAAYKESLKKNIALFESAKTSTDFVKAASGFETLANTEKKEWLPFYYAGICDALAAFESPKKDIDTYCNKADVFARKSDSLSKQNSEVLVLKAMIAAARIGVNQAQRGQKYGLMATKLAAEAIKLNDANPRAHFVKAKAILNTPSALGGGEKKAKPVFELVLEKLKTFKAEPYYPTWGKEEAEKELKKMASTTSTRSVTTTTKPKK